MFRLKKKRARELVGAGSTAELFEKALDALIDQAEKRLGKSDSQKSKSQQVSPKKSHLKNSTPPAEEAPQNTSQTPTSSKNSRYIPQKFKKIIYARSQGQCEYMDSRTHARCPSRYRLEVDHIQPLAKNGQTTLENLRHLCKNHNLRAAQEWGLPIPSNKQS